MTFLKLPHIISLFQYISTLPAVFRENYYFPYFLKLSLPDIVKFTCFYILYVFFVFPSFIIMHLCITQCTHWTPSDISMTWVYNRLTQRKPNLQHLRSLFSIPYGVLSSKTKHWQVVIMLRGAHCTQNVSRPYKVHRLEKSQYST